MVAWLNFSPRWTCSGQGMPEPSFHIFLITLVWSTKAMRLKRLGMDLRTFPPSHGQGRREA